jgi:hypothetical protein
VFFGLRSHGLGLLGQNGLERGLGSLLLVLRFRCGVSRAILAADVLAVDADLVGAKGGLAAMAGTADAHPDGLDDPLDGHIARSLPLARFERQSIFGEESAGLFLLDRAPVGYNSRFRGDIRRFRGRF